MIFGQESGVQDPPPKNSRATELLKTAKQPTHLNTPYQGWKVDPKERAAYTRLSLIKEVCGNVLIVKEKTFDGRWQLV